MSARQRVYSGAPWEQNFGYCRATRVGDLIYVAGTTATQDGLPYAPDDPGAQARHSLETIAGALSELGASLADVVRYRVYITDLAHVEPVMTELGRSFSDVHPTGTLVEVKGLIRPEPLVEIEGDAVAGSASPVARPA